MKKTAIRKIEQKDISLIVKNFCFPWSSVEATIKKWTRYYNEHQNQSRIVYILEKENEIIGYASLVTISEYLHFKNTNIPEINDVWIAKEWRNQGFGKMFIQYLEQSACLEGYQQIGVGLYADYGAAQKLYFRLGYIPDGYGVRYNYQPTIPGEIYPLDDELVLWMIKKIL